MTLPSAYCEGCEQRVDRCHCRPKVCTRDVSNVPMRDQVCPECGHWNGSHPIVGGSLKACVVCELVDVIAQVRKTLLYPRRVIIPQADGLLEYRPEVD